MLNLLKSRQLLRDKFQLEIIAEPRNRQVTTPDKLFLSQPAAILEKNLDNDALTAEFILKQIGISLFGGLYKNKGPYRFSPGSIYPGLPLEAGSQLAQFILLEINEGKSLEEIKTLLLWLGDLTED